MSTAPETRPFADILSDLGIIATAFGKKGSPGTDDYERRRKAWTAIATVILQTSTDAHEYLYGDAADPANEIFKNPEVLSYGESADFEEVEIDLSGQETYTTATGVYVARDWNGHTDVEVLRMARKVDKPVLLYGEPGTGKTQMAMAAFDDELITVLGSGDTEVSDLIGSYTQDSDGTFRWVDGPLLVAALEGRPILVDEIGLIDTKALAIMYSFMDGRREYYVTANPERGMVKAKDGFFIVAATNPHAPGVRLSEALLSRFPIQAEVTTDYDIARRLGVHPTMIRAAQALEQRGASMGGWAPQMRDLLAFRDLSATFGVAFAASSMIAGVPELQRQDVAHTLRSILGIEIPEGKV